MTRLTPLEFLDALFEAFDYLEYTEAEIDAGLREEGYDPDELGERFARVARETLAKVDSEAANR